MKIKSGFVLHSVGSEHVVVAIEERTHEFRGMIRLNHTGAFLWEQMQQEFTQAALANALIAEYGIAKETAAKAAADFTQTLRDAGVIEA